MRILLFSGSHSRHVYVHQQLIKNFNIAGIVTMTRESQFPEPPLGLNNTDNNNFIRHFKKSPIGLAFSILSFAILK